MATGSSFPISLDSFTNKIDEFDDILASETNQQSSAIEKLQAKVGIDNSAVATSHDYKLRQLFGLGGTAGQVWTTAGWANNPAGFSDPMTSPGDIIYKNADGDTTRLPRGQQGQVLMSSASSGIAWRNYSHHIARAVTNKWRGLATDTSYYQAWAGVCIDEATGIMVAVANGSGSDATGLYKVMRSTDAVHWESVQIPSNINLNCVCACNFGSGAIKFIALAGGSTKFLTSADGSTWTERTCTSDTWVSVCYSADLGRAVAVATSGAVMTTDDGINWTLQTAPSRAWISVCASDGNSRKFFAVANSGVATGQAMASDDGIAWDSVDMPSARAWKSVCYDKGIFGGEWLVVSNDTSGNQFAIGDGATFAELPHTAFARTWSSVCISESLGALVAVCGNGSTANDRIVSSTDLLTWTFRDGQNWGHWASLCFSEYHGAFVAVSSSPASCGNNDLLSTVV